MATYSSILAWRIPWTRSLAGYSPWGHKDSDTTEWLTLSPGSSTFSFLRNLHIVFYRGYSNLHYKEQIIKTVLYWHKSRYTDQLSRIEIPEINPHTYSQLFYNKRDKNIHGRQDSLFNKWYLENLIATCKRIKLHFLIPYAK